eukprot:TRINITY_DN23703_c0_g1_i1.p1 TRINITY_DN23703_c0_g1~~TRINITY_DN23703_c0_g1_i1.p1  ORF type:complete len:836 (+),score=118.48 TRINITY_DN23703_c0_g1_i1:353-2509(+)
MTDFGSQIYTLDLDEAVGSTARSFACSTLVKAILVPSKVSTADWDKACGSLVSNAFAKAEDAKNAVSSAMSSFTTISGAKKLLTGESTSSILSEVTKYFNKVCVTSCKDVDSKGRSYIYMPSPDVSYYSIWQELRASDSASVKSIMEEMRFDALLESKCPYDAKMCVPLPGVSFMSGPNGFCTFTVSSDNFGSSGKKMASYLDGVASSSIATDVSSGLDNAVGEIQSTWGVFFLVAVIAFVLGLSFLVLLRFCVGPIVWTAIILVFVLFMASGGMSFAYSAMCADADFQDVASSYSDQAMNMTVPSDKCNGQYEVESKDSRSALKVLSFFLFGAGLFWAILILCLCSRVKMAIAINEVAAMFVFQTPHIVLLPLVQVLIAIGYAALWMFLAAFLLSQVPADSVPDSCFKSYKDAMGDDSTTGKCNGGDIAGYAYKAEFSDDCIKDACCWRCYPARYTHDIRFYFSFFSFLWNNALLVALGQCIIAGAVGVWFFRRGKSGDRKESAMAVTSSLKIALWYHLGSLAFGSFILAVVQFVKYMLQFLAKQAEAKRENKCVVYVLKCLAYAVWCFEKCVKFLNKNAYIQIALLGDPFCTSARNAFFLILNNAVRFGMLSGLGMVIHVIGKLFVMAMTGVCGFWCLEGIYPDVKSPIFLTCIYMCMGYVIGSLFMSVFGLAVDTTLQCFIATEEMGIEKEFIPKELQSLVEEKGKSSSGCCGCC